MDCSAFVCAERAYYLVGRYLVGLDNLRVLLFECFKTEITSKHAHKTQIITTNQLLVRAILCFCRFLNFPALLTDKLNCINFNFNGAFFDLICIFLMVLLPSNFLSKCIIWHRQSVLFIRTRTIVVIIQTRILRTHNTNIYNY